MVVLNPAGILLGALRHEQLEQAAADTSVARLVQFGVITVRPSEQVADPGHTA